MDESTLTGKTIGKYKIEEKLGRGGMAEVYKGYQENLDRFVAIKVMHPFLSSDDDFLLRFKREARSMASLSHPNIVRIFDFDVYSGNSYYLVMEFIDGGALKEKLEELKETNGKMPLVESVLMMTDVADALAYAHRRGMIHRDIKPANIMLRSETGQAVLTDFGIVKLVGTQSMTYTATGALIGTPSYMSPEQALGQAGDERVDIYSLGVLLFQMVTNQLPFAADTPLAVVMKHVNEPTPMPVTFNPDIPQDLQDTIVKAMAKDPDDRFQTAAEMAAALRAVNFDGPKALAVTAAAALTPTTAESEVQAVTSAGMTMAAETALAPAQPEEITPPPAEVTEVTPQARGSRKGLLIGLGLLLLVIVGGIIIGSGLIGGRGQDPPSPTAVIVAPLEETDTPEPATAVPTLTLESEEEPDLFATQLADLAADLTRAAAPTQTTTPTEPPPDDTPTPSVSPTAVTPTAVPELCAPAVELVSATRGNTTSTGVFPDVNFTLQWLLRNSGNCPWTADFEWEYVEGETYNYNEGPIPLETAVDPEEEIIITANVRSPAEPGAYESSWQLIDSEGSPVGSPQVFAFQVVPRAPPTPSITPIPPTATGAPPPAPGEGQAAYIFTVDSCEYPGGGSDWRCQVTIIPYLDGGDEVGEFTVFVFDQPGGQATTYRGTGPFFHFAIARRCAAYNQSIRVVDDLTATEVSGSLYIDPDDYIEGGCTEP